MTRKLHSVAIIGAGRMGRRHVQAVRRLGLRIAGIVDPSHDALTQAQADGVPAELLFSSLDSLYHSGIPECAIVATTADSHCKLACEAATRGSRWILVEKPMATSLAQCDEMIRICDSHGARLAVNHQMRFMEQYVMPKRLFSAEAYGGLASMTVISGNFGLSMNGTHYFEAFRFIADEPIEEITAWFSPDVVANPRGAQFEDRAGCIRAVTGTGKRLFMDASADQGHGVRVIYAARNGMISVDELTGQLESSVREEEHRELPTTRYGMPALSTRQSIRPAEVVDTSAAVLRALLEDVDSVSGEEGRRVVEVLAAAYQSAEAGSVPVQVGRHLDRRRIFPWA